MINNNLSKYKGANIQYTCEDCVIGENFYVEFSDVPKVKPGSCEHYNINFLLVTEQNGFKYLISITCKNCKKNKIIELFNNNIKTEDGGANYICSICKKGQLTFGYLFGENLIDYEEGQEEENKDNEKKMIHLIFSHEGKKYNVNADVNFFISEAFHKSCEDNNRKDLENLDIQYYKKEGQILSQYKSIGELNLNNGDIISIELRENSGWNS